jgi:uncharacterized protein YdhG (YjbR/CyaY superfamily)
MPPSPVVIEKFQTESTNTGISKQTWDFHYKENIDSNVVERMINRVSEK